MDDSADDIGLTREPLDVAAAAVRVNCAQAGGIALFIGTTRAEGAANKKQGALLSLDYHAYEEMAIRELQKLVVESRKKWPIERVAVWHRLGEVKIGEASVVIAVSCPHRGEAFAACQFLIDELKKSAPIWKREVYQHVARWQGEQAIGK